MLFDPSSPAKAEMPPVGQMKQIAKTTLKINLCPELIMIPEGVSVSQLPCLSHKQIAEDCCLTIVGSLVTSGSKLGLALDQNADSQFWSMKPDGRIYSKLKPNLVLDVKGGTQYDQNHIILNTVSKEKLTQVWEAMVL